MIKSDGNCLFRALAKAQYEDQDAYNLVREEIMVGLIQQKDYLISKGLTDATISELMQAAMTDGEWGEMIHAEIYCRKLGFGLEIL